MAVNANGFTLVGEKSSSSTEHLSRPALSFWQDAWRRLKQNKVAVSAMAFLAILLVFALSSNIFVPQKDANNFNSDQVGVYKNLPPKISDAIPGWNGYGVEPGAIDATNRYEAQKVPSGKNYLFGTDTLGRSIAKRVTVGLRISLLVAFSAALIDLIIGVTYGLISGWKGGWVDNAMQRIIEIIGSIPNLIIVTMLGLVLGQGILSIILAIALFGWTGMARQVRNMTMTLKERDFVLAAKTLGESPIKIAIKHLLPNMAGVIIVSVMMSIPSAIMYESVLSAINLGVKPPTASLGSLISDAMVNIQAYPYQLIIPAAVLSVISLAFILFGDGLRDAFDPKASED